MENRMLRLELDRFRKVADGLVEFPPLEKVDQPASQEGPDVLGKKPDRFAIVRQRLTDLLLLLPNPGPVAKSDRVRRTEPDRFVQVGKGPVVFLLQDPENARSRSASEWRASSRIASLISAKAFSVSF